jgi:transcriptional regulator with XRE-family HTH domain
MKGAKLKERRKAIGLTQAQLAELLGVRMNTVARWENGILAVPLMVDLAMDGLEQKDLVKKARPASIEESHAAKLMVDSPARQASAEQLAEHCVTEDRADFVSG